MSIFSRTKLELPAPEDALPGRAEKMPVPARHAALGTPLEDAFHGKSFALFGLGCFWGAERKFWQLGGVHSTAAGYAGGYTPNPTYEEVCSGATGHAEVVRVVFDPEVLGYESLLRIFWESHDPTQGMRQGNDVGTQYRSAIYTYGDTQRALAEASRERYAEALARAGLGPVTTEIREAPPFYFAEAFHQQYLHQNPGGYCGLGGTQVPYPAGPTPEP